MEIYLGMEIIDLALYCNTGNESALIVSDVHIGYEEALNKQGVLVPRLHYEDIIRRIETIFRQLVNKQIDTIIVNGDLKHEFGTISNQEWRNTLKFIDLLMKKAKKVVLIKGNHDAVLGPIASKRPVEVLNSYNLGDILILHGDKLPSEKETKNAKTIVIGHEHPAVSIREDPRIETFKCFLKGKFKGKNLIVQPSLNSLVPGTDILREAVLSPFLNQNLDNFEVYAVEDKIYDFGKLKRLRR